MNIRTALAGLALATLAPFGLVPASMAAAAPVPNSASRSGSAASISSGGPMFAADRQIGVTSTSDRHVRTGYANITAYRDWIFSVTGL